MNLKGFSFLAVLIVALGCSIDAFKGNNVAKGKIMQMRRKSANVFITHALTDGNRRSCIRASVGSLSARVDLKGVYKVNTVSLFLGDAFENIEVRVIKDFYQWSPQKKEEGYLCSIVRSKRIRGVYDANCYATGRFVVIHQRGDTNRFTACEIEVYGTLMRKISPAPSAPVISLKNLPLYQNRHSIYGRLDRRLNDALSSNKKVLKDLPRVLRDIQFKLGSRTLTKMKVGAKLSRVVDILQPYIEKIFPRENRPVTDKEQKLYIMIFSRLMLSRGLANTNHQAPGVGLFPGIPGKNATEETVKIKVIGTQAHEAHSTGLYLPPGNTIRIKVLSGNPADWYVNIGWHHDDIKNLRDWKRYNQVAWCCIRMSLGSFYNGFGGIISIFNARENTNITIELSGVIRAPYFNLRDPKSVQEWDSKGRYYQAPWAEIAGDKFIITVRSETARKYNSQYLTDLMKNSWDLVVKGNFWLRFGHWSDKIPERMTVDVQITAGNAHTGYPIQSLMFMEGNLLSKQYDDIVSHELGHHLQDGKWTHSTGVESTNEIFRFFDKYLHNKDFFKEGTVFTSIPSIHEYLKNGKDYKSWKPYDGVAMQAYRQTAFHFGWETFRTVFDRYNKMKKADWHSSKYDSKFNVRKMEEWIKNVAAVVKCNIGPIYDFWGFPISLTLRRFLTRTYKRAFLPDDWITRRYPARVKYVKELYKRLDRTSKEAGKNADIREKVKAFTKILHPVDVIYL